MMPLPIFQSNLKAFELVTPKLLDVSKNSSDLLTNDDIAVKSII